MADKLTAYILAGFLILLNIPGIIWLMIPSSSGETEAIKIICVVFVGGLVNFFTAFAARRRLKAARDEWGSFDTAVSWFLLFCMTWMATTFLLTYIKQMIIPL